MPTCKNFWGPGEDCTPTAAIILIAVAGVLLLVAICCFCRKRRQRGILGPEHAYFNSLNQDDHRESLMRRFMRQSQLPAAGEPLLQGPAVRVSTKPGAATPPSTPGRGGAGTPPATGSGAKWRGRLNTGAKLDLIDNENCHEVVFTEDPIGCGAAGDVLPGMWRGKKVAVKQLQTMDASLTQQEAQTLLRSFQREVMVCCDVHHANLVDFFGYTTKPNLNIYMELVDGGSLDHHLYGKSQRRKWIPTHRQVLSVVSDVAHGMAYLHSRDPVIIHRDLKSPNLLLVNAPVGPFTEGDDAEGVMVAPRVQITDFGLSREKPDEQANLRMTNVSRVVGTPSWMAPELFDPELDQRRTVSSLGPNYTEAVDTYAFAVIITEMLNRQLPWPGLLFGELRKAVLIDQERPSVPDNTPPVLKEVIDACWRHEPTERPSFSQVLQALDYTGGSEGECSTVRKQLMGTGALTTAGSFAERNAMEGGGEGLLGTTSGERIGGSE